MSFKSIARREVCRSKRFHLQRLPEMDSKGMLTRILITTVGKNAPCVSIPWKRFALQMEGHPIFPGSVGENLTLWGVNWDQLQAGTILRFEGGLEVVLTKPVKPCQTIAASFRNGAIQRILHDQFPGWSRWYGKVLKEGVVRTGERLEVFR